MAARDPMTEKRKAIFLAELARHGVFARAARVASPNSLTGACASFRDEIARDSSGFGAQVAEAREQADGDLLVELHRRAVEGVPEDVYGANGQVVGQRRRMSDRLLIEKIRSRATLLAERGEGDFTPSQKVESSSTVNVKQFHMERLSPESQDQLREILERELASNTEALPREEGDE